MELAVNLMLATSFVGAFDVLYYHLYKFRLYGRAESAAEEVTHLVRTFSLIAVFAILMFSDGSANARIAVLALFGIDLINNIADTWLEKRSRENIGGVPSFEQVVHIFGMFMMGVIATTFWFTSSAEGFQPVDPTSWLYVQGIISLGIGTAMGVIEASLFARALTRRSAPVAAV